MSIKTLVVAAAVAAGTFGIADRADAQWRSYSGYNYNYTYSPSVYPSNYTYQGGFTYPGTYTYPGTFTYQSAYMTNPGFNYNSGVMMPTRFWPVHHRLFQPHVQRLRRLRPSMVALATPLRSWGGPERPPQEAHFFLFRPRSPTLQSSPRYTGISPQSTFRE